ncbi:MAG TPA: hypothetical protein VGN34_11300 [Ktedonobacteraceae bacterium]
MLALREALDLVPRGQLKHAYSPAEDTPGNLFALLSPDTDEQEKAMSRLWASICHQGSVEEAPDANESAYFFLNYGRANSAESEFLLSCWGMISKWPKSSSFAMSKKETLL